MRQFIKQVVASAIGTMIGFGIITGLSIGGLIVLVIALALGETEPQIKGKTALVFDLSTQITDQESESTLESTLNDLPTTVGLHQVITAIDQAGKDSHITGILLDGSQGVAENGFATLKELREALERFKKSGKKIIAYNVDWSEGSYYLGSVASQVIINPMGTMEFNGLNAEQFFLKGALDKFGIGMQIIRVGSYKAAVEPLTRQNYSPENRQQMTALLGDLWNDILKTVSTSRKLPSPNLQAIANNQGLLSPQEAQRAKLVDKVAYFDEVVTEIRKFADQGEDEDPFRYVTLTEYVDMAKTDSDIKTSDHKIAVLYAEGEIVDGEGEYNQVGGDRFAEEVRKLREDDKIKAIVLRINSPGGSATASDVMLRELQLIRQAKDAKQKKPIIVSMGNVAASGGYWIATGSNYIFAESTTITGSIGVFGILPNFGKISNNNGITWDVVKTGKLADFDTSSRPKTPAELAIYQKYVNETYDLFLDKVAQARSLPKAKVAQIAQGRVWSGEDAKAIGLVDAIGGLDSAIAYAAQQAKLGNDWQIEEYPKQRSWEEELIEKLVSAKVLQQTKVDDPLTAQLMQFKKDLASLLVLNDPRGVYARLPFNFRIK